MDWGFRALLMILHTYIVKYDLRTLRQIAERWAPNGENDTKSYIYNLCELTGWKDDDLLFFTPGMATKLATAIATIECGRTPKRVDVETGWTLCNKDLEAQRRVARLKRATRGNLA